MYRQITKILTLFALAISLISVSLNSQAVIVNSGDIIRVDFDLSAETPTPPYEGLYVLFDFSSADYLNAGESLSVAVFDEDASVASDGIGYYLIYDIVGSFDLTRARTAGRFYNGNVVTDSTAYVDSAISSVGLLPDLNDSTTPVFEYTSVLPDISVLGHDRIFYPPSQRDLPEPNAIFLLGFGLLSLSFLRQRK